MKYQSMALTLLTLIAAEARAGDLSGAACALATQADLQGSVLKVAASADPLAGAKLGTSLGGQPVASIFIADGFILKYFPQENFGGEGTVVGDANDLLEQGDRLGRTTLPAKVYQAVPGGHVVNTAAIKDVYRSSVVGSYACVAAGVSISRKGDYTGLTFQIPVAYNDRKFTFHKSTSPYSSLDTTAVITSKDGSNKATVTQAFHERNGFELTKVYTLSLDDRSIAIATYHGSLKTTPVKVQTETWVTDVNEESTLSYIGAAHLMHLALKDLITLNSNTWPRDSAAFVPSSELTFLDHTLVAMAAGSKVL